MKGFEYWPAKQEVEVRPAKWPQVTLPLKPMVDMPAKGWYSGSTHAHMNYGGNLRNTLEHMMLMARAEDAQVASLWSPIRTTGSWTGNTSSRWRRASDLEKTIRAWP